MEEASKWTNKIFVYFNPAVNMTIIMLSQIVKEDPFDLFNRLYTIISGRLDPTLIFSDIGIVRESALMLADILEEFVHEELRREERYGVYRAPLIDAMAFVDCKTMFYASGAADGGFLPGWNASTRAIYPRLSRDVVLKRFSHDMSRLYKENLLRSPEELLCFEPRAYDVLFNLRTHCVYHVSEHVSELLAASLGRQTLDEMVDHLARTRNLAIDNGTYSVIQETFRDMARKQMVDLFDYQVAV